MAKEYRDEHLRRARKPKKFERWTVIGEWLCFDGKAVDDRMSGVLAIMKELNRRRVVLPGVRS